MIRTLLFLTLGIILYAAHFLIKVEINVFTSFIIFTTYIVGPIAFVQATSQSFVRARIAYRKIAALNLSDKDSELTEQTTKEEERWEQIVFNDVSYEYSNGGDYKFALGPINLKINQGENLFICGGNGSGKSTFAKLLVGLYSAKKGTISFAGQEVKTENMQWYRNHFLTIFSDFYLFEHVLDKSGKIVEKKHIEHHLKELELFEKVDVVDGKVTSTDLSQGQRKRLAMLLAYSEDASIYLFDEWAADQDPTFREYFYKKILPELKQRGKTLIVITHDDKYFGLADRLTKFDNGVISKNLTNDKLLEPIFSTL